MFGLLADLANDQELCDALTSHQRIIAPAASNPFLIALRASKEPILVVTSSSNSGPS
jgi:hypothetical protein